MKAFLRYASIGIICGLAAFLLSLMPVFELIELKSYDFFHLFKKKNEPPSEIVIVLIDEESMEYFKRQWPWPRSIHAGLIKRLKKKGASVVGMDIIFAEPAGREEDMAFAAALKDSGNVVLASMFEEVREDRYFLEKFVSPLGIFADVSYTGFINVPVDKDSVVRKIPKASTAEFFALKISRLHAGQRIVPPEGGHISFAGPPRSFKTVSYYQAYDPNYFLPKGFFEGKIVLVGFGLKTLMGAEETFRDVFSTPYTFAGEGQLMYGVEIHANIVHNLLEGRFVNRPGQRQRLLLFLLLGLMGSFAQGRWRPLKGFIAAFSLMLLYLTASFILFALYGFWAATVTAMVPLVLPYAGLGVEAYIRSEKTKRQLRKAFSYYVSPQVLDSILSNPGMLTLGGKRQEATVLFSDIANFTTMAEAMSPEDLVKLLNRYFTEMTKIIFEHKGLVDKFIGDAIMAVWGCPVMDEEHALNAVRAAVAMLKKTEALRDELLKEGYPEISIRVGVSCGEVVVGNMGSSERFDYTVIGDTVNIASRLEGANKDMLTSVLVDGGVYEKVKDSIQMKPLGTIKVKGKAREVDIYTLKEHGQHNLK